MIKNILHTFLKIKMQKFPSSQILNISVFPFISTDKYVRYAIHKDALLRKPNPKSEAEWCIFANIMNAHLLKSVLPNFMSA